MLSKSIAFSISLLVLFSPALVSAGIVYSLNPGDAEVYSPNPSLPSWDGNGDQADATFALKVDFSPKFGPFDEVIWETGGTTEGASLLYRESNTLRFSTIQGGLTSAVDYQLSAAQIAAGEIFVSWVFDLGSDELRLITSHVTGADTHEEVASVAYAGTDWSDSDLAGLGSSFSTVGGYGTPFPGLPLGSATINATDGLQYYAGDAYAIAPVPEPVGFMALAGAVAVVCFQRRRSMA